MSSFFCTFFSVSFFFLQIYIIFSLFTKFDCTPVQQYTRMSVQLREFSAHPKPISYHATPTYYYFSKKIGPKRLWDSGVNVGAVKCTQHSLMVGSHPTPQSHKFFFKAHINSFESTHSSLQRLFSSDDMKVGCFPSISSDMKIFARNKHSLSFRATQM